MRHPQVALGEIATLIRGITYKPSDVCEATAPSAVACMRTKNVQEELDESDIVWIPASLIRNSSKYLNPSDILVSSANSWNLVGKGCWVPELKYPASAGGFISILRGNPDTVDLRYLYHWFVSPQTQAKLRSYSNKTTNISNLDHARTLATEIPLPPLEEQRRIAAILDKANQLRQLSHANLQSLDNLVRKVFSDMFGDPVDNERGWNSGCIGDFVAQFETGKSLGSGDGDVSDSLRIIRVSAVSSGNFKPEESKLAPKSYIPREHHFVQEGDLLFCRANTDMLIGEVAYVGQGVRDLLLSDKIWRFCWPDKSKSHALYVQQLFRHPSVRHEIRRRATGTSGSMLNISQYSVLEIPIILPPADLQNKFQDIAAEYRRLFLQNTRQAINLRLLSCSLNRSLLEN